jgi:hypothetical protein
MGLFGFGNSEGKIERLKKKATNKFGQAIERQMALKQLRQIGTPEALSALLARFTVTLDVTITDADEKREVFDWLVAAGEKSVEPIERFVATHDGVYWPLKALKEIAGLERAVKALLIALDRADSVEHPDVRDRLKKLADDKNDEVRLMALDGLMTYGEAEAMPIVVRRLIDPNEVASIRSVLFEQLVDHEWTLGDSKDELIATGVIPSHYRIDQAGRVVRAR